MRWVINLLLLATVAAAYRHHRLNNFRAPPTTGKLYALLVAGSDGWFNYRHQSDTAHSYHVLLDHGVPAENIIVMMKDDIANNGYNPFPGKMFNRPNGTDVYAGLKIDYRDNDVTPQNFLNVLSGNKADIKGGNGRVIESTSEDRIFVFFTDHGAVGLVAFPNDVLTVKDLINTLESMHEKKRYSQLVFYMEACESGSMFQNVLREDINIYALTAANAKESSWATYCDFAGLPCLGDLFSVSWMNDSDEEDVNVETMETQYKIVKKETVKSHVMQYGNVSMANEPVGWFQGAKRQGRKHRINYLDDSIAKQAVIPSRDVELRMLERQLKKSKSLLQQDLISDRILQIKETRHNIKRTMHKIVEYVFDDEDDKRHMFRARHTIQDTDCVHEAVTSFHKLCFNFNRYPDALKYAYVLNNLCVETGDVDEVVNGILDSCLAAV